MPQQTVFPLRFGLQVPRGENLQAVEVFSEGGLDLTQSIIENRPGCASELTNFEVALTGGYRRIDGFQKYRNAIVPGEGKVLGVAVYYPSSIMAARKDVGADTYSMYSPAWSKVNTSPLTYQSTISIWASVWNWTGVYKIIFTDGINPAYTWDGANYVVLNAPGSAADPKFSQIYNGYLFVAGYSSNSGAVKISAPLDETDWTPLNGAAEIVVGDTITGLGSWRNQLIIFCSSSTFKIVGNSTDPNSATPFTLQSVTHNIGCPEGRTIQEVDGDLLWLSQDGLRTISGTFNIGDTEIASVSRPIQHIVSQINTSLTPAYSVVVARKTQYRLFYPDSTKTDAECKGIIGSIRRFRDGHEAWEWGELQGIKPSCVASGYLGDDQEYVIHGGMDGYVYRQEIGNSLNGVPINEKYVTVPLELGDEGIRKSVHRISLLFKSEGVLDQFFIQTIYDYNNPNIIASAPIIIAGNATPISTYGSGLLYGTGVLYATSSLPLVRQDRQSVQGSGFKFQIQLNASSIKNSPYVIQGYYIEYFPSGRR